MSLFIGLFVHVQLCAWKWLFNDDCVLLRPLKLTVTKWARSTSTKRYSYSKSVKRTTTKKLKYGQNMGAPITFCCYGFACVLSKVLVIYKGHFICLLTTTMVISQMPCTIICLQIDPVPFTLEGAHGGAAPLVRWRCVRAVHSDSTLTDSLSLGSPITLPGSPPAPREQSRCMIWPRRTNRPSI